MPRIELTINVVDDDSSPVSLSCCTPVEKTHEAETSAESGCQCNCC